jgi:hypothetical protein
VQQGDRRQVLGTLAAMEAELAAIASWLDDQGQERAGILCQEAWRNLLAAQMLLSRDPGAVRGLVPHDHPRGTLNGA